MVVLSLSFSLLLVAGAGPEAAPPGDDRTGNSDGREIPGVVRYVDARGEVHYTNDPNNVPPGARTRAVRSDAISEISHHPPRAPASSARTPPPPPPAIVDGSGDELPSVQEEYWRSRFREANGAVASLEASLASDHDLERQLEPVSLYNGRCAVGAGPVYGTPGLGPGFCGGGLPQLVEVRARIRQEEVQLARAREDLQELERQASFRAVPREWRR